jgi:HAD superfamily hydrolase (TIGR01549 family)
MIQGIIFDLDGTLVDSLGTTFAAFNHALEALGAPRCTPREIMAHFGGGEIRIFEKLLGSRAQAEKAVLIYQAYMIAHQGRVPLFEGVPELLQALRAAGMPLAIFTGRGSETTEVILAQHSLRERFVTVVCDDHVSQSKPSPEGLLLCLERMKIAPERALFVGDHPHDLRAAHAAGAVPVAALWDGLADRAQLEPLKPRHWVQRPADVLRLLRSIEPE